MGVINNSGHAKALKEVTRKGINFIGGGLGKVVDLTKNRGFEIVNTEKERT